MDNVIPLTPRARSRPVGRIERDVDQYSGSDGWSQVLQAPSPFRHEELQAMRIDGALTEVLPGRYLSTDTEITPRVRAHVLSSFVPQHLLKRVVAVRTSACWVYGLLAGMSDQYLRLHAAPLLNFGVEYSHRPRVSAEAGVMISEIQDLRREVLEIDGLTLFTPLRTALDLARHAQDTEFCAAMIRRLAQIDLPAIGARGFELSELVNKVEALPTSASRSRALSRISKTAVA